MTTSVFAKHQQKNYPHTFQGALNVAYIAGGIPSDPKVVAGWIKTKLADNDTIIRDEVAQIMLDRGITADIAATELAELRHLNGFKRDTHGLYIEGRQLKACLKEAASVAVASGNLKGGRAWGTTLKGMTGFFPEHVFVNEDRLYLGVTEPTRINQRFVHTHKGSAIQYEEIVEDAKICFTVEADHKFTPAEWATLWLTAERQGLGASRSQGFGRFTVTQWDPA